MRRKVDDIARLLNILAPLALTLLGILLALLPVEMIVANRAPLVIILVLLSGVSVFAAWHAEKSTADQLLEIVTGGRHVCFFRVRPEDLRSSVPRYQCWLEATGTVVAVNYWVSPACANRDHKDPRYISLDRQKTIQLTMYKGARAWNLLLPKGDYFIEFDGANGNWVQRLTIDDWDGVLTQMITVTRGDGTTAVRACDPWHQVAILT